MHDAALPLSERRLALQRAEPKLYPRDQAIRLGVSECALVALDEGAGAVQLRPDFAGLLSQVHRLGPVMALTRNADAVHEKTGTFGALEGTGHGRLFLGEAIDLRLFLSTWRHGWAVGAPAGRRSLQFFGADGTAVHKIYAVDGTDLGAWLALVAAFVAGPDHQAPAIAPKPAPAAPRDDAAIDVPVLQAGWDGLRDTHDFHPMLKRHGVTRLQALRLAGRGRAPPAGLDAPRAALQRAAESGLPIMVFVGNGGCIQIHTGPVERLMASGAWFNVLDPGFNLHLRESGVASAWVVSKPTDDGAVTSLEAYDADGALIVTLFGKRKPGQAEDGAWRDLAHDLPDLRA